MSDDLDLVGFAIGLVNSVLNLPNGQVKFSGGGGGTTIYGLYKYVLL